jgi:hypothetical protein
MIRRTTTFLLAFCVVLLAAVVALMVASRFTPIDVTLRDSPGSAVVAGVREDGVYVLTITSPRPGWRGAVPALLDDWTFDVAGFKVGPEFPPGHWLGLSSFTIVPFWFLLLVFGGCAGVCWGLRRVRDRALPPGGFAVDEGARGIGR